MAQNRKSMAYANATSTAYAVVCTNQSALKLDDLTPNFTFHDGKIEDVETNEEAVELEDVVEQSIRYVPVVRTICKDLYKARYLCLSLMTEYQGTEVTFHVEEVVVDNTTSQLRPCADLEELLAKVEVKELMKLDDKSVTPTVGKIDLDKS